jgi:hypothetical protein
MPSFSTSSLLVQPQSKKMFLRVGASSFSPPKRVWIAGQPKTALTMPLSVWISHVLMGLSGDLSRHCG